MPSRTSARYLAPAALVAAAVAVYLVGFSGGSDSGSDSGTPASTTQTAKDTGTTRTTSTAAKPTAKTYTVQAGDVLSSIADKTGVSVERLQQLNPNADAQSLRIGQTLKLTP
jgi:LysM repeat protein